MARKTSERICDICGKHHSCHSNNKAPKHGSFCSLECRKRSRLAKYGKDCIQCGIRYIASSAKSMNTRECCSRECRTKYRASLQLRGKCRQCGALFNTKYGQQTTFCSWDCYVTNMAGASVGNLSIPESVSIYHDSGIFSDEEWVKCLSKAKNRLSHKERKSDEWEKRIQSALCCLRVRIGREQHAQNCDND